MPSWKDIYSNNRLLSVKGLNGKSISGVIDTCEPRETSYKGKDTGTKLAITLTDYPFVLILNQINVASLDRAYGEDYEDWIGKRITLRKGKGIEATMGKPFVEVIPTDKGKRR